LDLEESVEAYIKDLARDYTIKEVRFDPYQFARSSQTLAKLGIRMVEFPQTQDRLTSMSQNLYDLIKGGGLVLYRDRQMRDHAQKATAKETARGWRLTKKKASHKIDLIIALAMAALGATQIKQSRPGRVYVNKGEPLMDHEIDALNAKREPGKGHVYVG
jgi:phage terminase large subunit-like protein